MNDHRPGRYDDPSDYEIPPAEPMEPVAGFGKTSEPQTHDEARWFHEGFLAGATAYAGAAGHSTLKSENDKLRELFDAQGWRTIEMHERLPAEPLRTEPTVTESFRAAADIEAKTPITVGQETFMDAVLASGLPPERREEWAREIGREVGELMTENERHLLNLISWRVKEAANAKAERDAARAGREQMRQALTALRQLPEQVRSDLASAHAELRKAQGADPAMCSWPEWTPQANTLRWLKQLEAQADAALADPDAKQYAAWVDELVRALQGLAEAVVKDSEEKGISGYTGARLSDARAALAARPDKSEAQ